jgi:hypothetical protein
MQQHPRDFSWPSSGMSLYECTCHETEAVFGKYMVKWSQEAQSPKLIRPCSSSTGRRRQGVPVRVAWCHQRSGEKAHATSSVGLCVKWISGVHDVPLVGNRVTTSGARAQVVGMHSNTRIVPGLQKVGNLVDTVSSPREVMAYLFIIDLAPLEVRSFCHPPVGRSVTIVTIRSDFRFSAGTIYYGQLVTFVPNRGGGHHRASKKSRHMGPMTIRAQRGAARALSVELVRLLVMHGTDGTTQNLNKEGYHHNSLAARGDNEMSLMSTWV